MIKDIDFHVTNDMYMYAKQYHTLAHNEHDRIEVVVVFPTEELWMREDELFQTTEALLQELWKV